jgi:hypothetical protein
MNRTVHKFCAWSGWSCLVILGLGFVLAAGFVPNRSPSLSAVETAHYVIENKDRIRWGIIISVFGASLLMPFVVSITLHMRRIEGRYPALALIQFGSGAIFVLEFLYLLFFWQTATFRVDRSPELIQLLNDLAWIPFVGLNATAQSVLVCFGITILLDRREKPIFPRWLGYYNFSVAFMLIPGTFNVFFHDGPLAWSGVLSWYIPLSVFGTWLTITPYYLSKAVDGLDAEHGGAVMPRDGASPQVGAPT